MTLRLVVRSSFIAVAIVAAAVGTDRVAAQGTFSDVRAIVEFQRAADTYAFLHRQVERRLGQAHRRVGRPADEIETTELDTAIVAERSSA